MIVARALPVAVCFSKHVFPQDCKHLATGPSTQQQAACSRLDAEAAMHHFCQSTHQPTPASLASSSQQQPMCNGRCCQTSAQACPAPDTRLMYLPHQSHPQAGAQAPAEPHDEPLLGPRRHPQAAPLRQPAATGPGRAPPCPSCRLKAAVPTSTQPDRLRPGSSCRPWSATQVIAPLLCPNCQRHSPAAECDGAGADWTGCQHRAPGPQRVRPHRASAGSV